MKMFVIEPYMSSLIWLVVVGFIIAFILAFGIGANDVANSFGTSVGSKVLTVRQACILATIFEIAGAILIGYKVSDTMRKGIIDVNMYEGQELDLMLGCVSALTASATWLLIATFLKMPISGTHSIVGATVGFSFAVHGTQGIKWTPILTIVMSWFVSPALSGIISSIFFLFIQYFILRRKNPVRNGLLLLPFFYGFTSFVNIFSILHDGPKLLHMDKIPLWLVLAISCGCGIFIMLIVQMVVVPWQRRKIKKLLNDPSQVNFSIGESTDNSPNPSPTKKNRFSQISDDKQLTVIRESAEMLPLSPQAAVPNTNYTFPMSTTNDINKNKDKPEQKIPANKSMETDNSRKATGATSTANSHSNYLTIETTVASNNLHPIQSSGTLNPMMTPNTSTMQLLSSSDRKSTIPSNASAYQLEMDQSPSHSKQTKEIGEVAKLFSFLQVLTAVFGSFAHGGNDVSNAIGPLVALWLIYSEGSVEQKAETPLSILLFGGVGISIGLWVWGRRVIKTVGEDLTTITPENGFAIELGSAFTVLLASKIGIPISTTHCKVGSVVFVGLATSLTSYVNDSKGVDWGLFRNIISAWLITVPMAAILSAGCMVVLRTVVNAFYY